MMNTSLSISPEQFRTMLTGIGLDQGDCVYVASSMTAFHDWENPAESVYSILRDVIGASGTIVMPAFNFGFCRGEEFDVEASPAETGILSEYFRNRDDVFRTCAPPFHSVCIQGPDAEKWASMYSASSFGPHSVFQRLVDIDARHLSIGCGFHDGVVHVHAVEERLEVPYRYWKRMDGHIQNGGEPSRHSFFMYARNLELNPVIDARPAGEAFYQTGSINRVTGGLLQMESFSLKSFDRFIEELLTNDPWALVSNRQTLPEKATHNNSPILGLDHIGILSKYADQIEGVLNSLGVLMTESGIVEQLGVECRYFNLSGVRIETVVKHDEASPLGGYMDRHASHPLHHLAFRVSDIDEAIAFISGKCGIPQLDGRQFDGPRPGEKVTFLSPVYTGGLLIELVEVSDRASIESAEAQPHHFHQSEMSEDLVYG